MNRVLLFVGVAVLTLTSMASSAAAGTVFVADLKGEYERPVPVITTGNGTGFAELTGSPDAADYVLHYALTVHDLSSAATGAFIHVSTKLPGEPPREQIGEVVHAIDLSGATLDPGGLGFVIEGDWRFDDALHPLGEHLVDSLFDGELYFNVKTGNHADGEIRGQLEPGKVNAVPLPAPALMTGIGLAIALPLARRRMA
ncbi:MAG: CHRD domain-containing protein [Tepidisphaeraceae bacterium]